MSTHRLIIIINPIGLKPSVSLVQKLMRSLLLITSKRLAHCLFIANIHNLHLFIWLVSQAQHKSKTNISCDIDRITINEYDIDNLHSLSIRRRMDVLSKLQTGNESRILCQYLTECALFSP